MKKGLLSTVFSLLAAVGANAQNQECLTPPFRLLPSEYYIQKKSSANFRTDTTTLYIPVTVNIIGETNGTGYYPRKKALDALCKLQTDFEGQGFHFYLEGDFKHIDNSAFFDMDDSYQFSADMHQFIEENNTLNTLSIYIIKSLGGASGFTSFEVLDWDYDVFPPPVLHAQKHAVVVTHLALNNRDHILAHELGHYFGLYHTFEGADWSDFEDEGTPDTTFYQVYYPQNDTTISYHWLIDRVDGINCALSGDLICDTPPDYLEVPFTCNADGQSDIIQTDPTGATFRSDGTLFMSYSRDACQNRFSPGQADVMRAVVQGPRDFLLYNQNPPLPYTPTDLNLLYPPDNATIMGLDSITLEWAEIADADYYLLEFGRQVASVKIPILKDERLTDTKVTAALTGAYNFYWTITAVNRNHPCKTISKTYHFTAEIVSGTEQLSAPQPIRIFPNPAFDRLHWQLPESVANEQSGAVQLFDAKGRLVYQTVSPKKQSIDLADFPAGLYTLKVLAEKSIFVGRFLVQ